MQLLLANSLTGKSKIEFISDSTARLFLILFIVCRILYTTDKTNYTSFGRWSAGSSCTTAAGATLNPNEQIGDILSYTASATDKGGSWFPGTPCHVDVVNLGCYLAWSNDTHYYEEGNYVFPGLDYATGCPDCSRAPPSSPGDGMCSKDGSLSCAADLKVNYRCTARKAPAAPPPSTPTAATPTPKPGMSARTFPAIAAAHLCAVASIAASFGYQG